MNNFFLCKFLNSLILKIPIERAFILNKEIIIKINYKYLLLVVNFLKNHQLTKFKILSFITVVDYPELVNRFELNYQFLSILFNQTLRIKFQIQEWIKLESLTNLYNSANWLEREVWDLFGVFFKNNLDLRRLLTDYGFSFFPLRKDFPLSGFIEIYFNPISKIISYKNIYLFNLKNKKKLNFNWSYIKI